MGAISRSTLASAASSWLTSAPPDKRAARLIARKGARGRLIGHGLTVSIWPFDTKPPKPYCGIERNFSQYPRRSPVTVGTVALAA